MNQSNRFFLQQSLQQKDNYFQRRHVNALLSPGFLDCGTIAISLRSLYKVSRLNKVSKSIQSMPAYWTYCLLPSRKGVTSKFVKKTINFTRKFGKQIMVRTGMQLYPKIIDIKCSSFSDQSCQLPQTTVFTMFALPNILKKLHVISLETTFLPKR